MDTGRFPGVSTVCLTTVVLLVTLSVSAQSQSAWPRERTLKYSPETVLRQLRSRQHGLGKNPEADMNTTQLLTSKGYPAESHSVVTEDGYILGVSRVPHGRHRTNITAPRPVVILQHGLLASCDDWLLNSANESLAYILADAGADVWLPNSRGNRYSRRHTSLKPTDNRFWKFSWDQMAKYDLPAVIHYILNKTGQEQLFYVGHSQGTITGFALFGEDPALAAKVKHFLAMAPIARVSHTQSPIKLLAPIAADITYFLDVFGHGEFGIPQPLIEILAGALCEKWGDAICENFLFLMCGFNYKSMNASRMDVYLSHDPAGTSAHNLLHWAQNILAGQFQHFDYGEKENLVKYGQKTPPLYDPSKVKVPVAVFRGGKDWLADETDVNWLLPQLNVTNDVYVPFYEHLDMTFAYDAHIRLYPEVLKIVFGGK